MQLPKLKKDEKYLLLTEWDGDDGIYFLFTSKKELTEFMEDSCINEENRDNVEYELYVINSKDKFNISAEERVEIDVCVSKD